MDHTVYGLCHSYSVLLSSCDKADNTLMTDHGSSPIKLYLQRRRLDVLLKLLAWPCSQCIFADKIIVLVSNFLLVCMQRFMKIWDDQGVQTLSFQMNKFWGANVHHGDYS